MPRRHFHGDWLHWFPDCPDRRRGPDGQARAEEGTHCPADGQAQVQEEGAEAPRLRQPVWCHRDEGACGLWDQQVGGPNSTISIYQLQLSPCLFSIVFWLYFIYFLLLLFFSFFELSQPHWATFLAQTETFLKEAVHDCSAQPRRPSTSNFSDFWGDVTSKLSPQQTRWLQISRKQQDVLRVDEKCSQTELC